MKFLSCEKISEHKYKTPEGYLICIDSILARTGKQTYKRREVFGVDCTDAENEVDVDRTPEEVFSDKTLASFENKPLTMEHPDEDVNIDNHNTLSVGFARDIKRGKTDKGEDVMLGTLVFTDADAIEAIENGDMTDLSCGYDCDIVDEANPCQRNIRGNHIALCQQGRAGIARIVDSVNDMAKLSAEESATLKAMIEGGAGLSLYNRLSFDKPVNIHLTQEDKELLRWHKNENRYLSDKEKLLLNKLVKDSWDEDDDDLSNEEKELCDYMLRNVYEKGMSPEKLLNKMSSYYSMYQRLARHKPEDVKEYFREKIRTGYYDSIKDNDDLPEEEDSEFLFRDAYGKEIIVTNWDGKNQFMVVYEGREQLMNRRDVEYYLDRKGAKFSRVLRDSTKDTDASRIAMAEAEIKRVSKEIAELNKEWKKQAAIGNEYNCIRLKKKIDDLYKKLSEYRKLAYKDSTKDSLREPTSSELKKFEDYLIQRHWHVKKLGVTWTGRIHYEVSKLLQADDNDRLIVNEIGAAKDYSGLDMTYSIGSTGKELKGVVDIDKVYVRDSITDGLVKTTNPEIHVWKERGMYRAQAYNRNNLDYSSLQNIARKNDVKIKESSYGYVDIISNDKSKIYKSFSEINPAIKVGSWSIVDSNTYKEVTKNLKEQAKKEMRDDASFEWMRRIPDGDFEFIKGGYGMRFKDRQKYENAKRIAKQVGHTKGHWYDKDLEYFEYGSTQIGNEDSVKDSLKQFKVKYKDSKGRQVIHLVKAESLADAIKKVKGE